MRYVLICCFFVASLGCSDDSESSQDAQVETDGSADGPAGNLDEGVDVTADAGMDMGADVGVDMQADMEADMEADMDVGDGSSPLEAHGCTFATSTDRTGEANVMITDISAWVVIHNACIIVDAGTTVTWEGNFDLHPLRGGVSPTPDAANPVEIAGPGAGMTPVSVTLDTAGDYPYFCGIHLSSMAGVIYVR